MEWESEGARCRLGSRFIGKSEVFCFERVWKKSIILDLGSTSGKI